VTVRVPADAAAGTYHGSIRLIGRDVDSKISVVPLRLRVLGFALPHAPRLHSSYWVNFGSRYDATKDRDVFERMIWLFGAYRVSTNVWLPPAATWYREEDGSVTCDISGMLKNLEIALEAGFRTLNIGPGSHGVWGDSYLFYQSPLVERGTGKLLSKADRARSPHGTHARAYLRPLCNWLQERGLLSRACLEIRDEARNPGSWKGFIGEVEFLRKIEPRIQLRSVLGVHPDTQGLFDVWSPHNHFYDRQTYDTVRRGVSLRGPKNFKAETTASSTGGWGNASFYTYRPADAYDGCDYTKWIPKQLPTKEEPQWLRFDFDRLQEVDGIRLVPYGASSPGTDWTCEGSADGKTFQRLTITLRGKEAGSWSFPGARYKAVRLVWIGGERIFVPTGDQPIAAPEQRTVGVREVEFLRQGLPVEATLRREIARPANMMWEYNVGADYPGLCIDSFPVEHRATGWLSWYRNVDGYLNYGGAQWTHTPKAQRPKTRDPWVWIGVENGVAPMIVYPGKSEVLPSIRFSRFRDGVDDFDCLHLLKTKHPGHPLLVKLRAAGREAFASPASVVKNRLAIGDAL